MFYIIYNETFVFLYLLSEALMGNVTKYLQKLGMGIYYKENQPSVLKKNNQNLEKPCFTTHQLEVKYAVDKQISVP